ncbi:MAG: hypothetical protein ACK5RH_09790, partial [Burkholderiales bacterium]
MQDNERIESSELPTSRPKSWEHPGRRRLPVLAAVVLVIVALIAAYTALFGKSKAAPEVTFKTLSGEHLTTQQ